MNDKEFLYNLNQTRQKELYAKITALNFEENPLEQIEGKVTGGSLNIDGSSSVRRTCNLTMVAKNVNISDFYWSVSNKFILEIGIKNKIDPNYPDIIWFKEGVFVISSFNVNLTNNAYNISISGKDKMCLLNGDIGGNLHASIDFGKMDFYDNVYSEVIFEDYTQYKANKYYIFDGEKYNISTEKYNQNQQYFTKDSVLEQTDLKLKDIIREAVHVYGKEMYHNIVINDLDDYGLELLEYRGSNPLYMLFNEDTGVYDNMTIDGDFSLYKETPQKIYAYKSVGKITLEEFNANPGSYYILHEAGSWIWTVATEYDEFEKYWILAYVKPVVETSATRIDSVEVYNTAVNDFNDDRTIYYLDSDIKYNDKDERDTVKSPRFSITKVEPNQVAGYRTTDLVYAGSLISSIGESLTSILDKIKNMLGPFEYFYDKDGHFIFQAKKIYANESWNTIKEFDGNPFARDAVEESPYSYSFEDMNLIQRFQNVPNIAQIKNDYSIWGVRKSLNGSEIPIHARYAIHEKPVYYKNFNGDIFSSLDLEEVMPVPDGSRLPECLQTGFEGEWWDIHDWAEVYKTLTGEYPTDKMGLYGNRTCKLDLNKYFPAGVSWNPSYNLFLFEVGADGNLKSVEHNPMLSDRTPAQSCFHSYTHFINRA